jgi:DNA-binding beta-propeller fold protein YncE
VGVYDTDSVAFIDTATRKVSGVSRWGKPHNIAIRPDGRVAYVGSQVPAKFALEIIDLATRRVTGTVPLEKLPVVSSSIPTAGVFISHRLEATAVAARATDR